MNRGTSQVNWEDVTSNKAKISEYKERMLAQKQELGFMKTDKATVKANSFVNYGSKIDEGFMGQNSDALQNKAKDQRTYVSLANPQKAQPFSNVIPTESR